MGILDRKTTSTQNVVNETVNTDNRSYVRDIGLTGKDASNLAGILVKGSVESRELAKEEFGLATQMFGEGFNQLVGGSNYLTQASSDVSANILKSTTEAFTGLSEVRRAGQAVFDSAGDTVKNALAVARDTITSNQTGGISAFIPLIGLGIAAYILLKGMK